MAEANDIHPWERQEGETPKAWEAFVVYRDLGSSRSLRGVANHLSKGMSLISRWSSRWNWVERAAAWDADTDRASREAQLEAITKMAQRHANLAQSSLIGIGMAVTEYLRRVRDKDILKELSDKDLISMMLAGMRLVEGMARVEKSARGVPETWVMISQYDDEQLEAFVLALLHERERAGFGPGIVGDEEAGLEAALALTNSNSQGSAQILEAPSRPADSLPNE